jgi:hypothetical protein
MSFPPATIQLDPTTHQLLGVLATRLKMDKGDVLKRSLSLYNYLVDQSSTNDIVLRNIYNSEEQRLDLGVRDLRQRIQTDQERES